MRFYQTSTVHSSGHHISNRDYDLCTFSSYLKLIILSIHLKHSQSLKPSMLLFCLFFFNSPSTENGSCVLKASVDRVSVDTIRRYGVRHLANISTDNRLICQPSVGWYEPTCMLADTQPILHRHSAATRPPLSCHWLGRHLAATRPPLGRHSAATRLPLSQYFTNTWPTLSSLGQLLLPSCICIFPALLREAFSGHRPFLAFNSGNIHVFFPAMFFPRHHFYIRPSLYFRM